MQGKRSHQQNLGQNNSKEKCTLREAKSKGSASQKGAAGGVGEIKKSTGKKKRGASGPQKHSSHEEEGGRSPYHNRGGGLQGETALYDQEGKNGGGPGVEW